MSTNPNICFKHFAEYTLEQCEKLGIETTETKEAIHFFCAIDNEWKKSKFSLPHAPWGPNKVFGPVILLPQNILESMISYKINYFFTNIRPLAKVKNCLYSSHEI